MTAPDVVALRQENELLREENLLLKRQLGLAADAQFLADCRRVLGLSPALGRLLSTLMHGRVMSREQMLSGYWRGHVDDEPDLAIINTQICHLRRRLQRFDITIETLWGLGYRLSPESRETLLRLLGREGGAQ